MWCVPKFAVPGGCLRAVRRHPSGSAEQRTVGHVVCVLLVENAAVLATRVNLLGLLPRTASLRCVDSCFAGGVYVPG